MKLVEDYLARWRSNALKPVTRFPRSESKAIISCCAPNMSIVRHQCKGKHCSSMLKPMQPVKIIASHLNILKESQCSNAMHEKLTVALPGIGPHRLAFPLPNFGNAWSPCAIGCSILQRKKSCADDVEQKGSMCFSCTLLRHQL